MTQAAGMAFRDWEKRISIVVDRAGHAASDDNVMLLMIARQLYV